MGLRITTGTLRPAAVTFVFDGIALAAYPGETVAAALLASNIRGFRRDMHDKPRGPYCNMGTCFECLVEVQEQQDSAAHDRSGRPWRRVRACMTPVSAGLEARTAAFARPVDVCTLELPE